mgnify:CR=1 FL=1|jgi:hypothetical protein
MFVIFGWDHQKTTNYGAVEQHKCQNCHNTEFWQLDKISKYFTFFFIPIFPHGSDYWFHCPTCNYGIKLNKSEFENYKSIAEINSAFLEKTITEEERTKQLDEIYRVIDKVNSDKKAKNIEESKEWVNLAREKTNEELFTITTEKRNEYNPAFIIAAEMEIVKRSENEK